MTLWMWLRLLRPTNSVPAVGLLLVGAFLAGRWPWPGATWWAALAMWAVTSFGYVTNDLHDIDVDRVNKPDRPLPSGRVNINAARGAAALLAVIALVAAARVGWMGVAAAGAVLGLLVIYNVKLKGTVLWGNALIACLSSAALLAGGYTVGRMRPLLGPAMLVGIFIFSREVLKTIEDVEGDRLAGCVTVATAWGPRRASQIYGIASAAWLMVALSLRWLYRYSDAYLALVAAVGASALYSAWRVLRDPTPCCARIGLRLSKVGYLVGLLALFLA